MDCLQGGNLSEPPDERKAVRKKNTFGEVKCGAGENVCILILMDSNLIINSKYKKGRWAEAAHHLQVLLLCWGLEYFALRNLQKCICRMFSRPLLHSAEEPRDSWETELFKLPVQRYTSFPPSLKHEQDPEKMTDGGSQIFRLDRVKIRDCLLMMSPFLPTSASSVMKECGGAAAPRQQADNQITQDYVSHLTCIGPVPALKL